MLVPLGVAAWLVLEVWLLTVIAGAVGGWAVFLMLLAGAVCGGVVVRRAGRRALRTFSRTLQQAQSGGLGPQEERGGGSGLLIAAGLLLAVPGPLSDGAGLLLLVPQVRRAVSRAAERAVRRRLERAGVPPEAWAAARQAGTRRADGKVVQGEVVPDDEPKPPRRGGPRPPLGA
jgi:UPF0716 protein FxsA